MLQSLLLLPDLHEVCAPGLYCNSKRSRNLETVSLVFSHHHCPTHKLQYVAKPKYFNFLIRHSQLSLRHKIAMPCSKPFPMLMFKLGYTSASPRSATSWIGTCLDQVRADSFICMPCSELIPSGILFIDQEWDKAVCESCPAINPVPQICSRRGG